MIRQHPDGVTFTVHVVPGASGFSIAGTDEWTGDIKIRLKNKATEGKANQELTEELGRILSADVKIITGHKSRRKTLLAETDIHSIQRLARC